MTGTPVTNQTKLSGPPIKRGSANQILDTLVDASLMGKIYLTD